VFPGPEKAVLGARLLQKKCTVNNGLSKTMLLVWIAGALFSLRIQAADVEPSPIHRQAATSGLAGCLNYFRVLAHDSIRRRAERTPVANFRYIENEGATPIVIPRPNVLVPGGSSDEGLVKIDPDDAFLPFAQSKIELQIPFPGKTAAIGAHGVVGGPLVGLSTDELVTLLVWLKKKKEVDTVAILSCDQNVLHCGNPMLNPYFETLAVEMKQVRSPLPRIVVAHPPLTGELVLVQPSTGGQHIVGWKHPEGEFVDVEDGERYLEVVFTQQIYPYWSMMQYRLHPSQISTKSIEILRLK